MNKSRELSKVHPESIYQTTLAGSFNQARSARTEATWQQLAGYNIKDALDIWLLTLQPLTRMNYRSGFKRLSDLNIIDVHLSLQQFSLINHEAVIDEIKLIPGWSEATRQARAAAYISFTGFLHRRTQGIIHKAVTNNEGTNKTFYKIRDKVKTNALTQLETRRFLDELAGINVRDALIAKLILQGGKRKTEVLSLKMDQIDFDSLTIRYHQTKTRGMVKLTVINYPPHIMQELREYTADRSGFVFVTRNGKRVMARQIDRNFIKAGNRAGIRFRVTPHVLRVTLVTRLKELRVQDSDIMKITGHANPAQLSSYDKSDLSENATLYHHFV